MHRSGPGTLSVDETLLVRLGRTLGDLTQIGGQEERSRAYLSALVTANSGSATPPPAGFVQVLIDGVGMLCLYFGTEPTVGDRVAVLMVENSNPLVIYNQTSGLVGSGWPFDTAILTVDTTDLDADYVTVAAAIAAVAADELILVSPEAHVCDNQALPADTGLGSWDRELTFLSTATQLIALTTSSDTHVFQISFSNSTNNAANTEALRIGASGCELWGVGTRASNGAAGGDGIGFYVVNTVTGVRLTDCYGRGSSVGGLGYGLYIPDAGSADIVIRDGTYNGNDADLFIGSGSTAHLYGPRLVNGTIGGTGTVTGWYYDESGAIFIIVDNVQIASGFDIDPEDASGQDLGDATHRWDLYTQDVIFGGASGANVITVPDNVADALHIDDAGGLEYQRIVSTNAQPIVHFNQGEADVDFRVSASGITNALFAQGSDGHVSISGAATYRLNVYETFTGLAGIAIGTYTLVNMAPGAASAASGYGFYGQLRSAAGNNQDCTGSFALYRGTADWYSTGTLTTLYGFWPSVLNRVAGTVIQAIGVLGSVTQLTAGGQITSGYGLQALVTQTAGTLVTGVGLHIAGVQSTTVGYGIFIADAITGATQWGIYQAGATDNNYFAAKMAVGGTAAAAAQLHVDQPSGIGAIPVALFDQADEDIPLLKIIGIANVISANKTLVAASDYGTPGALVGWVQIAVQDDGNRVTDADYWMPFYAIPT